MTVDHKLQSNVLIILNRILALCNMCYSLIMKNVFRDSHEIKDFSIVFLNKHQLCYKSASAEC